MSERERVEAIVLIYEPVEDYLNSRQRIAYREHRRKYIDWLANEAKDPDALGGYAPRPEERELYDKYDDTDQLWLTRHGNPSSDKSLKVLSDNLRDMADIERKLTWYAVRHSTGTYMACEERLAAAQSQLRHRVKETTMRYDQAPMGDRRNARDRVG